ncbi:aldehyde dehydrogenase family protein [Exilibacterium tricleocarpae]|uniref:Aldehyde dehydrogenase family protein n=1 Tax=Exilibacterium tricleocarpae TaxID=2591008 RepID=A0A545TK77_9GAMM|nr:aldehyde dehydrogenase family protein [Exilibacterium tricleocarpae]TQV77608.1 aldehyde dehydrogenase family protein [Exilibacterium tricleocarpae]
MVNERFFYAGEWQDPLATESFDVHDPASGERIGKIPLAGHEDIDRAVQAARQAVPVWASMHADERARIIHKAADLIVTRIDEIAELLTREQGKPVSGSRKEIEFGIEVLRYYAQEGRCVYGSLRPSMSTGIKSIVSYQPLGVVAAIVPWNYPVDIYCWKIGAALAAGCPIVVKPPHETPFAIGKVVECFEEAGLPPGVLANLPGTGPVAGAALAKHPGVDAISATASVAAGQDIMRNAAGNLKRLSLELGGHSPFIVLPDADIEEAASAAMRRSFSNMGQICIAVNRILVHQAVHKRFIEALTELTTAIELGHGMEPGVEYGPALNQSVIERTQRHIKDALAKGGKLITGGDHAQLAGLEKGFFFRPTLIDKAPLNSLPMTEETYGPLAAIHSCDCEKTLLDNANSLPYGLAAYVFSRDLERAWDIADQLEFGAVGVNINDTTELQAPFGGWKLSGIGSELGPEGLHAFLQPKHVKVRVRRRV